MDTAIFEPYFRRIEQRHGLTRSMNQGLRSHPVMVDMVREAVTLLIRTEALFGMAGTVRMNRQQLYRYLLMTCDTMVDGQLRPYPYQVFNTAMTVAKHVGLIAGWGRCGLHPDVLKRLRRMALTRSA